MFSPTTFDSFALDSFDKQIYFRCVKYPSKYVVNETIAENGVCPFIYPCFTKSIRFGSIVLLISIILSFSNPAAFAHASVTSFGFIIRQ